MRHRPISRRTVTKGIAWSAPALAIAVTAPAFAASPPRCTATAQEALPCNTVTGSGSYYPWMVVTGGPVTTPTTSALYGDQSGWSTQRGLATKVMLNGTISVDYGGSYLNLPIGMTYSWQVKITVPTASTSTASLRPSLSVNEGCTNAALGNGQFSNPTLTTSGWSSNGNGTSSTTLTITTTNQSEYTVSPGETVYISVALDFTLPVLPGTTGNVKVSSPYTNCTGPTQTYQFDRNVTWLANNLASPSNYRYGYWFTGTATTGTPSGPAATNGAASVEGSGPYNTYSLVYTN